MSPRDAVAMQRLADLRLSIRSERRTAGIWLLGFGLVSVVAGGATAVIGRHEHVWLAAGLTSASFGAVNALLSLGLMDLSGADLSEILRERTSGSFAELREAQMLRHLASGQFFAINSGLDVAYIATGALLTVIASVRSQPDRWELGAGLALVSQGLCLLLFDIVNWMQSNTRAADFRALAL